MDLKGKKIAVTGAGGFIGRNLLGGLEERGAKITGFDLPGVKPVEGKHIRWVESDLSDESAVRDVYKRQVESHVNLAVGK